MRLERCSMRPLTNPIPTVQWAGLWALMLVGCVPKDESGQDTDGDGIEQADGNDTGDGESDDTGEDTDTGKESHYLGGWPVDACNDSISATGNEVGDIVQDWTRMDQYGDDLRLHDFCGHAVLLVGSAFW